MCGAPFWRRAALVGPRSRTSQLFCRRVMGVATGGGVMEEGVWMSGVTITCAGRGGTGIIGPVVEEEEEEEKAPVNQQQATF